MFPWRQGRPAVTGTPATASKSATRLELACPAWPLPWMTGIPVLPTAATPPQALLTHPWLQARPARTATRAMVSRPATGQQAALLDRHLPSTMATRARWILAIRSRVSCTFQRWRGRRAAMGMPATVSRPATVWTLAARVLPPPWTMATPAPRTPATQPREWRMFPPRPGRRAAMATRAMASRPATARGSARRARLPPWTTATLARLTFVILSRALRILPSRRVAHVPTGTPAMALKFATARGSASLALPSRWTMATPAPSTPATRRRA